MTTTTNRRDFLKNAAILSGATGLTSVLPASIQKAMAINAKPGTTYKDAEHIVFLMQENRSFDHMFGTLKGVRGFNDPHTHQLPGKHKVWLQKDKEDKTYPPFHIDINKTKVTWQGGLPHSWLDQQAARNKGLYDKWVPAKSLMTMGYFDRSDVPFYYALADAFTVCDHNFCSSLTGTTPNRLYFWSGTVRPEQNGASVAAVRNSQAESRDDAYVDWGTFPELLEDNGVSWKIYQNELWTADLPGKGVDYWLGNYGDNAIEYVRRHRVKLSAYFRKNGDKTVTPNLDAATVTARYNALSQREKNLVDKAFTTNIDDQGAYLELAPYTFTNDEGEKQTIDIPAGDVFRQFRKDVKEGTLPTVSWLVAPQSFSDHTSTPLYGTWYVSQVLDILTQNPEVWKKTIFIINYDENDGYFDHIPPFVTPKPGDPSTGKVSAGIDPTPDYEFKEDFPIGLGYRVPMIVASPWSKGGYVNSEVFDHTSTLMFLEKFLQHKTGKEIKSPNISSWRRAVCGDMTSVFRSYNGENIPLPDFEDRGTVITNIHNARSKPKQLTPAPLSGEDIQKINDHPAFSPASSPFMPQQEKGTKPACALPYQLLADAGLNETKNGLKLRLESALVHLGNDIHTKGAAFTLSTPVEFDGAPGKTWAYATAAGSFIEDTITLEKFKDGQYNLLLHGPNGFYREFKGTAKDPGIHVSCRYERKGALNKRLTGDVLLVMENNSAENIAVELKDNAYGMAVQQLSIPAGGSKKVVVRLKKSEGWYDFTVNVTGNSSFARRYAGHVEMGRESITDPYMGGIVV